MENNINKEELKKQLKEELKKEILEELKKTDEVKEECEQPKEEVKEECKQSKEEVREETEKSKEDTKEENVEEEADHIYIRILHDADDTVNSAYEYFDGIRKDIEKDLHDKESRKKILFGLGAGIVTGSLVTLMMHNKK